MAWSKLKSRWRALLAPEVAKRVDVHMAGYRAAYEQRGRAWLTVDGEEVFSLCEFRYENAWREEVRRQGETGRPFTEEAHAVIRAQGMRDKHEILDAIATCISQPIEALMTSKDPIVRALAMLDRRLGKRRLAKLDVTHEHPLVQRMYAVRTDMSGTPRP